MFGIYIWNTTSTYVWNKEKSLWSNVEVEKKLYIKGDDRQIYITIN